MDEPLGTLDARLREEMQIELINLQKEVGGSLVFVIHTQNEALALSHRITVMNQDHVEQVDKLSVIHNYPAKHSNLILWFMASLVYAYRGTIFDPENKYSAPYTYTVTPLGFNQEKLISLICLLIHGQLLLSLHNWKIKERIINDVNEENWNQTKELIMKQYFLVRHTKSDSKCFRI
ncbi:hypothetical protein SAMN05428952_1003121 [Nitrosomonas sp. Nm132]|nr:hypothetical protein SAMN05428952_1003121 [Nitrosomonas sp. Nm132]